MAGHSKWAQIKRKKAANDKQRGKTISKHIRAVQAAVRSGGSGDPSANLALKNALAAAKSDDVPQDNIDRAIERALGGGEGGNFDEVVYEGYGPAGVALLVEALTDNRNRTVAEVRHAFNKHGGSMSGSTAWQFESKGIITLADTSERAQELAIELGAEDLEVGEQLTITTAPGGPLHGARGVASGGLGDRRRPTHQGAADHHERYGRGGGEASAPHRSARGSRRRSERLQHGRAGQCSRARLNALSGARGALRRRCRRSLGRRCRR